MRLNLLRRTAAPVISALLLLTIAACGDHSRATGPISGPASADILDGVHNSGNAHFFFLPPLVPAPAFHGQPTGTQSPTVTVCEWSAAACTRIIAQFTLAGGTGSEAVRYDATTGEYIVNWHTDRCTDGACTLDAAKVYRLRVLVGSIELGHADVDVVANGSQLKNVQTGEYIGLVDGRTMPVKFRIEQGAVAVVAPNGSSVVGSGGGSIATNDGLAALAVPAGALTADKTITIAPATTAASGSGPWTAPVDLGPTGTTFASPVTLTLAFDATKLPPGVPASALRIYTEVDGAWEEVPGSVVSASDNTVSAPISHFSNYSILIRPNQINGNPGPSSMLLGQTKTLSGWTTAYVSFPQQYCYIYRVWTSGFFGGYWTYYQSCYTTTQTYSYYPTGERVFWTTSNTAVATFDAPGYSIVDASGGFTSPLVRALSVGATNITANIAGQSTSPVQLTVLPSLSLFVAGDPFSGPRSDTFRETGIGQAFPLFIKTPAAVPADVVVTLSHSNPSVASTNPTATIHAGNASEGLAVGGVSAGRDTIVVSATGYGPDTVVVQVGTGRTLVEGWPATLASGDSAPIRVRPVNPPNTIIDNAYNTTFTLTPSANLQFSNGTSVITSIHVPDGTSATPVFYVKAIGFGGGSAAVTHPNYVTTNLTTSITPPPLVGAQSVCGHWITGIAYDGSSYYVAEGHDGLLQCLSRFSATTNVLLETKQVLVDHRGLHWVPSLGKLTSRTWGGPIYSIDFSSATIDQLASNPTSSRPGDEQSQPAVDPDGQSYWILNAGQAERRRLSDHGLLKTISVTTTAPTNVIAVSNQWVFALDGAAVNAYSKTSGALVGRQPLPHAHPCNYYGFGVSLAADRIMYVSDCHHVEVVPVTVTFAEPPANPPFVVAGGKSSCAMRANTTVLCWGESSFGATDATPGPFATIGAGFFHYCGIKLDQTLNCWGYNSDNRATPPAGTFKQITVGAEHNCALRLDNTAACWGFLNDGRGSPPAGTYKQIAVGWYHGCAIRPDDTLVCWGQNDLGKATAPAGTFLSVTAGAVQTCAIRTDHTLLCFGDSPTPPTGTFTQINASSGGHTCGVRTDGTLACWGQNNFGQATPPAGQFLEVAAGWQHSCAVRTDRVIVCWGLGDQGATIVPSEFSNP